MQVQYLWFTNLNDSTTIYNNFWHKPLFNIFRKIIYNKNQTTIKIEQTKRHSDKIPQAVCFFTTFFFYKSRNDVYKGGSTEQKEPFLLIAGWKYESPAQVAARDRSYEDSTITERDKVGIVFFFRILFGLLLRWLLFLRHFTRDTQ